MSTINPSLDKVSAVADLLGSPQDAFKAIHIAGTNGKGSVCNFLERMHLELQPSLKVGSYTSPHLISPCERIKINGNCIAETDYQRLWASLEEHELSWFERSTLVAFIYFKEQAIDLAILEVGLGGRWDATNIIKAEHSLATAITSIALDHQEYLGNSIESIRKEKEAIIKTGVPHFDYQDLNNTDSNNPNSIQGSNFLIAKAIFETIHELKLSDKEQKSIVENSKRLGRFEYDPSENIFIDGAHNPAAAEQLRKHLNSNFDHNNRIYILGFLDKDYQAFIDNLEIKAGDQIIFCDIDNKRNTGSEALSKHYQDAHIASKLKEALELAKSLQKESQLIVLTGSLYLVGDYYKNLADKAKT